jgi:hypothetical protein
LSCFFHSHMCEHEVLTFPEYAHQLPHRYKVAQGENETPFFFRVNETDPQEAFEFRLIRCGDTHFVIQFYSSSSSPWHQQVAIPSGIRLHALGGECASQGWKFILDTIDLYALSYNDTVFWVVDMVQQQRSS